MLLVVPAVLLLVEIWLSTCESGGYTQSILAIVTLGTVVLFEAYGNAVLMSFVLCAILAILAWGFFSPRILCACHVNLWLLFLNQMRHIVLATVPDPKWRFDSARDVLRGMQ